MTHTDPARGFVVGAAQTIDLLVAQDAALRRAALADDGPRPHCDDKAVVCDRVRGRALGAAAALHLERLPLGRRGDSGWMVGRTDCEHDHDARSFGLAHLKHLAAEFPVLLSYVAAPVGTALLVQRDRVIVFAPGEASGRVDDVRRAPSPWRS